MAKQRLSATDVVTHFDVANGAANSWKAGMATVADTVGSIGRYKSTNSIVGRDEVALLPAPDPPQ